MANERYIHIKMTKQVYDLWFNILQRSGRSANEVMADLITRGAQIFNHLEGGTVYKEWVKSQIRHDEISMIKQIALRYLDNGTEENQIALIKLCDEHGLVFSDVVTEAENSRQAQALNDQFSNMSETQKVLYEVMQPPGKLYAKQEVVELVVKRTGYSAVTVDRAKKELGLEAKKIPGSNRVAWYIPNGTEPKFEEEEDADLYPE